MSHQVVSLRLQQVLIKPGRTKSVHWWQRGGGLLALLNIKSAHPPYPFDTLVTGMAPPGHWGERLELTHMKLASPFLNVTVKLATSAHHLQTRMTAFRSFGGRKWKICSRISAGKTSLVKFEFPFATPLSSVLVPILLILSTICCYCCCFCCCCWSFSTAHPTLTSLCCWPSSWARGKL